MSPKDQVKEKYWKRVNNHGHVKEPLMSDPVWYLIGIHDMNGGWSVWVSVYYIICLSTYKRVQKFNQVGYNLINKPLW